MAQVTIEAIKNGPYIVTGEVELIDADGNKFQWKNGWRSVAAARQPRNPFATARIPRSVSRPLRKQCRNRKNDLLSFRAKLRILSNEISK